MRQMKELLKLNEITQWIKKGINIDGSGLIKSEGGCKIFIRGKLELQNLRSNSK
jgi:hypothetical protein